MAEARYDAVADFYTAAFDTIDAPVSAACGSLSLRPSRNGPRRDRTRAGFLSTSRAGASRRPVSRGRRAAGAAG
jgi:hypothetical protein